MHKKCGFDNLTYTRTPLPDAGILGIKVKLICFFLLCVCVCVCVYIQIDCCVGSSLLRAGFLQLQQAGATLCCGAWASHYGGFSCCRAQALGAWASVVVARGLSSCGSRALERRLSSCGARAQLLRGMWDLPRPGLEPVSAALAGGFLSTAPPGQSRDIFLIKFLYVLPSSTFFLIRHKFCYNIFNPKNAVLPKNHESNFLYKTL